MAQSNGAQEPPGAVALWRELQGYLEVETEFGAPETAQSTRHGQQREYEAVKVKIRVSNTAPDQPGWPRIVFMGIVLAVAQHNSGGGNLPDWARRLKVDRPESRAAQGRRELSTAFVRTAGEEFPEVTSDERSFGEVLIPGQSITFEMDIPSKDVPYVEFRLDSTVSRRHFFHSSQELKPPDNFSRPPLVAAFRAFNKIGLHDALSALDQAMPDFGPNTRLADIQAFNGVLATTLPEIESTVKALNSVYHEAPNPRLRAHIKAAGRYLLGAQTAVTRMKEAISSSNAQLIQEAATALRQLKLEASSINRATKELMSSYAISDEEAGYRYKAQWPS